MADLAQATAAAPTVYFIDDSATMREVIKIAFRRENIHVVACHDAASAFEQIEQVKPDVVISDVIMPDKDGYEVCQYIKQHPVLGKTPVILMSGVVNRAVAEKAFAVKADELIRKPFQPQDLITRVRHLLRPGAAAPAPPPAAAAASAAALSSIFAAQASGVAGRPRAATPPTAVPAATRPQVAAPPLSNVTQFPASPAPAAPAPAAIAPQAPRATPSMDIAKTRLEIMRLEGLVKKLQAELEAEREYSRALEAHIKTLQESE
ncbi:MAG: response regulator [Acidobacteriia bacterium]|nr:response regulator [Terriglobia bacterium]